MFFKIQFRKKKMPQDFNADTYREPYPYANDGIPYDSEQAYRLESLNPCFLCNDIVSNGHLVITIKRVEYFFHPSCLLSGLALLVNYNVPQKLDSMLR